MNKIPLKISSQNAKIIKKYGSQEKKKTRKKSA